MFRIKACLFSYLLIYIFITLTPFAANSQQSSLEQWMKTEGDIALTRMNLNISPTGAARGVVIASPSRQDPDYYFHWTRDAALVMETFYLPQTFADYTEFSRQTQLVSTLTGLGEPRFNIDGTAYTGPWARPQNDGPALRVLTILRSLRQPQISSATAQATAQAIVQTDLQYILNYFRTPSFCLWEEVKGDHFYTRLVQMAALKESLEHFDSNWNIPRQTLQMAMTSLQNELGRHWRDDKKYFSATLNRIEGAENYKFTDLDTAVILAVLHANLETEEFSVRDERILATASQLETAFVATYEINAPTYVSPYPVAPAIGRYTDDIYFGGNPWYITTAAFAELHYRLSLQLIKNNSYVVTELNLPFLKNALTLRGSDSDVAELKSGLNLKTRPQLLKLLQEGLLARGDLFMARLRLHTPADGSMAEQFARKDGQSVSARDLTWSYASFLSALKSRKALFE